mmetsp:Transcript_112727/g.318598  ORF Transcript_112727/g.318598 Transcript_112727/m.318598 type:complete len:211 (-) Transcript_112727:1052-1684(-)
MPLRAEGGLQGRSFRKRVSVLGDEGRRGRRRFALIGFVELLPGCSIIDPERLKVQELRQGFLVRVHVAVVTVFAAGVRALQLRDVLLAEGAEDEIVGLVRHPVALHMQLVVTAHAHAVPTLGAIAGCDQAAIDAVELPLLWRVQVVSRVMLFRIMHFLLHPRLRPLVLHNLQAPLHLLNVKFALVVHLGEGPEERLDCPHHEGLVHEVNA